MTPLLERLPNRPDIAYAGDPHSPAWHATRARGLGGSDVAAAMGEDDYRTPFEVYASKVDPAVNGDDAGEPAQWGTRLEPVVAHWAARELGAQLHEWPAILRSRSAPWMLGSLDHLIETTDALRVLEVKVTRWPERWFHEGEPDLPRSAEVQARWYLAVTGLEECIVSALLHGTRGVLRTVRRDERLERVILDEAEAFWERIERRDPPPPGPSPRVTSLLNARSSVQGVTIDLDESWRMQLDELRGVKQEIADLEEYKATVENALRAQLGDAEYACLDGDVVATYKTQQRKAYSVEASTSRPLRIKGESK